MTKAEILQQIANSHNLLAQISVNGEGAILMGQALMGMRALAREIQKDVEAEKDGRNIQDE